MKRLYLIWILLFPVIHYAQVSNLDEQRRIIFPDIPGYFTLKCDLHQHTVFSDGYVWPTIRVKEAIKDNLDAIASGINMLAEELTARLISDHEKSNTLLTILKDLEKSKDRLEPNRS